MQLIKDILTVKNGKDYCITKVLTMMAFLAFVSLSAIDLYLGGHFNAESWAIGAGGLIFGGSAGMKIKESTEPN